MTIVPSLHEWAARVSANKKELDKRMFDDLFKNVVLRLERDGYEPTLAYLKEQYLGGLHHRMVGPVLLSQNSKIIMDKLWSLHRRGEL